MRGAGLEPVGETRLVRDRAFAALRDAIVAGRLAPGLRLVERELCDALGISRPSVRESIRRLEAERLVVVEPHRGPVVATLTRRAAREIYEIRGLLESLLVRRFAEEADAAALDGLAALFGRIEAAAALPDPPGIVRLTGAYYDHLLASVGHGVARDLLAGLDARIALLRLRAMAHPGRLAESLVEQRAILAAIRARDGAEAARLVLAASACACAAALEQLPEEAPQLRRRA